MHNIALRQLLVQQRMEEAERDALRIKLGRSPESLSRTERVAYAIRAGASVYRSLRYEPDPAGASCIVGDEEGILVWTSTSNGSRVLTCRPAASGAP